MTTAAASMLVSGMEEIQILLNSRRRLILVQTYEEERFTEDMKSLIEARSYKGLSWTASSGLRDVITREPAKEQMTDPIKMLQHIMDTKDQTVFILKDFHDIWDNKMAKRKLRDVIEWPDNMYKPIIIVAPQCQIPTELEKLVTLVKYDLPDRRRVTEHLESLEAYLQSKDLALPTGREREAIINALVGMTDSEVTNVLKKSVAKHKAIVLAEIVAEKEQVIRKTGLLEYITKLGDMGNVGGMDVVKSWLTDAYFAFDPEARNFGVDPVRGAVLAGWPGAGKSLFAKATAFMWNLPLLKMNMSDIMDSRVGQSEKNIARALKLAEAVSPCVLWIDELEKGLAGIASSDKSDSGTLSRVVQELLTWLSEKEAPVFVIATANDVTKLPPELTRAGRFDEVFFVSLPHDKEREQILSIHLQKRGYQIVDTVPEIGSGKFSVVEIAELASRMKDFSGAEIEQVVAESGRRAYASFKKNERTVHHIQPEDLVFQIETIVPLAKRNPQLLADLRNWAKHSAKCASSEEHNFLHKDYKAEGKSKLRVIGGGFEDLDLEN
ncbi:AAA family ATPase (plasmid) [Paenibacillus rhizovicinus]|uniref:Uncharacterized AAA domain-containing protein ycf46 n=1 Tax=Paenibacillus rhizovicinus TaxID=2704463 RepID=A0A6C0PCK4_9BACL|nr:AAA family ATPase [Paenibacillus rhizovicinus]QHW35763.1 AAA family ATPase [Paenibacillus rhizovicinus]